jgi:hypothetical protein
MNKLHNENKQTFPFMQDCDTPEMRCPLCPKPRCTDCPLLNKKFYKEDDKKLTLYNFSFEIETITDIDTQKSLNFFPEDPKEILQLFRVKIYENSKPSDILNSINSILNDLS